MKHAQIKKKTSQNNSSTTDNDVLFINEIRALLEKEKRKKETQINEINIYTRGKRVVLSNLNR